MFACPSLRSHIPPSVIGSSNMTWAHILQSYISTETGWLRTQALLQDTLVSLHAKLTDFGMEDDIKTILQHTNLHPVVVDSGASACSSPDVADFIEDMLQPIHDRKMGGIASGLPIKARGIICYEVMADDGTTAEIQCWGYPIPDLPMHLMSPQVHLRDAEGPTALFEYGMQQDVSIL